MRIIEKLQASTIGHARFTKEFDLLFAIPKKYAKA